MHRHLWNRRQGFTVIEIAMVMVLSGLIMALGFNAYTSYIKRERAHDAYDKQKAIATSLSNYSTKAGRLPCPADPSLPLIDPNAGVELSDVAPTLRCTTLKLSPDGTCMHFDGTAAPAGQGICKTSGRDTAVDPDAAPDPVLIGAIPYVTIKSGIGLSQGAVFTSGNDSTAGGPPPKECLVAVPTLAAIAGQRENTPPNAPLADLVYGDATYCDINSDGVMDAGVRAQSITANFSDISLKSVLDAYGFQMTYAVTGALTAKATAHNSYGAINVKTEDGIDLVKPAGSAHYAIVAHGDNHLGAFNAQGRIPFPCTTGVSPQDEENCDWDATFVQGLRSANTNTPAALALYYDDTVWHSVINISSLWEFVDGSADIYNLNIGNVGVGTTDPLQRLDVNGNLRAQTASRNLICDSGGANCWTPDALGGDPTKNDSSGNPLGALCSTAYAVPAGKMRVVVGIKNGRVKCSSSNPADPDYDPAYPDPPRVIPILGAPACGAGEFMKGFSPGGTPLCCNPTLSAVNPLSCSYVP